MVDVGDFVTCPRCGRKIEVLEKGVCPWCDRWYARAWCEHCQEDFAVCPECGYTVESLEPDETIRCPKCGAEIHAGCLVI